MDELLKRKIDKYLIGWKNNPDRLPLFIRGARQIGKTRSIEKFAYDNYQSVVEINFVLKKQYLDIFDDGYDVDTIIKNISFKNPSFKFIPGKTLIFFDEIQANLNAATAMKSFSLDGRYDVICSGSLMGINYQEIESNSVGYKTDYDMKSLDFEEFLWAKGYSEEQLEGIFTYLKNQKPLPESIFSSLLDTFKEYVVVGGMPAIVKLFIDKKNYSGVLDKQKQIIRDYEEDITKYANGLDKTKILNVFHKIPVFLGNENKKFMISKVEKGKKSRDYLGVVDWLVNSGIVNISYCLEEPSLPLKGHYNPDNFRLYFMDTGILIGSLDDEAQEDFRIGKNMNTMKGAIYENIVADTLVKAGYDLFFYKDPTSRLEMDFFVRRKSHLVPIEVKATDGMTISLNNLINKDKYKDISYGIKLALKNIGHNEKFYTIPYFLTFMLKRFLEEIE
ncbi:MAG: ATP-binding protein [Bacilli bacterium]|nr:ATP-binding protein [Bacilli bacterium]